MSAWYLKPFHSLSTKLGKSVSINKILERFINQQDRIIRQNCLVRVITQAIYIYSWKNLIWMFVKIDIVFIDQRFQSIWVWVIALVTEVFVSANFYFLILIFLSFMCMFLSWFFYFNPQECQNIFRRYVSSCAIVRWSYILNIIIYYATKFEWSSKSSSLAFLKGRMT